MHEDIHIFTVRIVYTYSTYVQHTVHVLDNKYSTTNTPVESDQGHGRRIQKYSFKLIALAIA